MQYTYDSYTHANGTVNYKITESGTAYHVGTPDELVLILERLREQKTRVTIDFGNTETGKSWEEQYDISGTIGRSFGGKFKIPLLIHNRRSVGGGGLLDDCILSIRHSNKRDGGYIYKAKIPEVAA